jgi:hypothetical protein
MRSWLIARWQWPAAALFAAAFLITLIPFVASFAGLALTLVYAQLPAYMLHQFEEHHDDCFCTYVNKLLAGGRTALAPGAAFVINSVFVRGVDFVALYLARFVSLGLGLIAVDLALVNATAHLAMAAARREYNPGVWTSAGIFVPLGAATYAVLRQAGATVTEQLIALGVALAIHAGIIVHVRFRIARIDAAAA